jgi:N,N'-diacetyllegionaminate synthase
MSKPFIIAEIAQGYEGNEKLVKLFVTSAAFCGADAVKFHIFYANELAVPDYRYFELFKSLELPFSVWEKAVKEAHHRKLEFYSDLLGIVSFRKLENIGVDGYKIHTTDINNVPLLKIVAKSRKKIFISTGGCQEEEIARALDLLSACHVTLMHGFQAEPTELQDNHLNRIRILREKFNKSVGFQDHTAGDSKFALYVPSMALGVGVDVIEKHLTLSRVAQMEDCISA